MKQRNIIAVARTGLVVVLVLLACWLAYMSAGPGRSVARAEPGRMWVDSAQQRQDLIEAQQETNRKLDEIIRLLKSGDVRVQSVSAEPEQAEGGRNETATQPDGS